MHTALPSPLVLPVIHVQDLPQSERNARLALEAGADGVFVISMDRDDDLVDAVACRLKTLWPTHFIGANYLTLGPVRALERSLLWGLDGTWSDAPGVDSRGPNASGIGVRDLLARHPKHAFFGSVAFKYQAPEADPARAATQALALGMVPTTSGAATGSAPALEKLQRMRQALGPAPLALASGLTPRNLAELGPCLTHLLVATGISRSFYDFDPELLAQFVAAARALR